MCSWWAGWWRLPVLVSLAFAGTARDLPVVAAALAPNSDDEIVYFDNDRVIRVFDPSPTSEELQVEWASPGGGWGNFALGDLTGDGDMEIVAIRPEEDGGRLTIFDPVAIDSPEDQVELLEGVPWATLYEITLPQSPRLIATGEFDTSNNAREILYSFALNDEFDRFVILRTAGGDAPGRNWEEQIAWNLEERWSAVATGNVYLDDAIDEIGLASFDRGELGLFRIVPEVVQTFTNVNREHRWRNVALGQFVNVNNDGDELAAVRDADTPIASTWVFRYNGTSMVDQLGERISPSPNVLFFADIRGNGDDELVLLRQVRPELGPRARLIVRDGNNNDAVVMNESLLDGDNEYKGGDGGDVDGDERDEIVIVRNNRIRIYYEPESSVNYELVERFTDGQTVKLGNLDAGGLASRSRLVATESSLSADLRPGQRSSVRMIEIKDITRGAALPFSVTVEDAQPWIEVTPLEGTTPLTLSVTFSAEAIQPGEYSGSIVVEVDSTDVENNQLRIAVALSVNPVVAASPATVIFDYYPCSERAESLAQRVALSTTSGASSYTTQIEGNPAWVRVAPEAGTLPEEVVVSIDPLLAPDASTQVDLLVTTEVAGGAGIVNRVPIHYICATNRLFAPLAGK